MRKPMTDLIDEAIQSVEAAISCANWNDREGTLKVLNALQSRLLASPSPADAPDDERPVAGFADASDQPEVQAAIRERNNAGFCTRYVSGEGRHRVQADCPLAPGVPCSPESEVERAAERGVLLEAARLITTAFSAEIDNWNSVASASEMAAAIRRAASRLPAGEAITDEEQTTIDTIMKSVRAYRNAGVPEDAAVLHERIAAEIEELLLECMERRNAGATPAGRSVPSEDDLRSRGEPNPDGTWVGSPASRGPLGLD